jgi:hypothetical protein
LAAGAAAAIEPAAVLFAVLLVPVILVMRWRWPMRLGAVLLYGIGMTPAILLYGMMTVPLSGDWRPVAFHPEIAVAGAPHTDGHDLVASAADDDDDATTSRTEILHRLTDATVGDHGAISHFPILLLGVLGIAAVMHRHWPATTKLLAVTVAFAAVAVVIIACALTRVGAGGMFAARYFVVFLPFLAFFSGAWMRRPHGPLTWAIASGIALFSISVSLIGATNPLPRGGYDGYSAVAALNQLLHPAPEQTHTVLANR